VFSDLEEGLLFVVEPVLVEERGIAVFLDGLEEPITELSVEAVIEEEVLEDDGADGPASVVASLERERAELLLGDG
jgi:hypothetical protein